MGCNVYFGPAIIYLGNSPIKPLLKSSKYIFGQHFLVEHLRKESYSFPAGRKTATWCAHRRSSVDIMHLELRILADFSFFFTSGQRSKVIVVLAGIQNPHLAAMSSNQTSHQSSQQRLSREELGAGFFSLFFLSVEPALNLWPYPKCMGGIWLKIDILMLNFYCHGFCSCSFQTFHLFVSEPRLSHKNVTIVVEH